MKNTIKIGIIVIALAGAIVVTFVFNQKEEVTTVKAEAKTWWACAACKGAFELTQKEVADISTKSPPPNPPIDCMKCKADKAYRGKVCGKCKTVFLGEEVEEEGVTGVCPKCNPEVKTRPKPVDEEAVEEEDTAPTDPTKPAVTQRKKRLRPA